MIAQTPDQIEIAVPDVHRWLHDATSPAPNKTRAWHSSALYAAYVSWAEKGGARYVLRPEAWGQEMINSGFPTFAHHGARKRMLVA